MAALQIRSMPSELYDALVRAAKEEHRSINQQAIAILQAVLMNGGILHPAMQGSVRGSGFTCGVSYGHREDPRVVEERKARRRALFAEIDEFHKKSGYQYPKNFPSPTELIREDRDR